jgi:hypothetical protein
MTLNAAKIVHFKKKNAGRANISQKSLCLHLKIKLITLKRPGTLQQLR